LEDRLWDVDAATKPGDGRDELGPLLDQAERRQPDRVERTATPIQTVAKPGRRREPRRVAPMPEGLIQAIDERYAVRAAQLDPLTRGARLWAWHRTTVWRVMKDVMVRSGVAGRPACPRGLRHGFGVGTLQAGVPINLVQRWLGHARLSTTAIYAAASGPEEQAFAARFWLQG
jgi:integrase